MHCSQSAQYSPSSVHSCLTPTLTSLLPDVLPNIFSRLPVSDLLTFSQLNKEARHASATLLMPRAISLFDNFNVDDYRDSLKRVAAFCRKGCPGISDENWLALLKTTAAGAIDRQLLEVLLFAFAADDVALPTIPTLPELREKPFVGTSYGDLIPDRAFEIRRSAARNFIVQTGAQEMFDVARCNNNPTANNRSVVDRRGWTKLTAVFEECSTATQVSLLSNIQPAPWHAPEIHLAFEELVIAHIGKLVKDGDFVFAPEDYSRKQLDAYYMALADFYTFTPCVGERAFFVSMFSKRQSNFPDYFPWKDSGPGTCNFVFRLLAAEIRGNKTSPETRSSIIESLALRRFITREELDHFARNLNARMDRGMTLEIAVGKWLDDSRAAGKCAIS
jgi:hypothetical protein